MGKDKYSARHLNIASGNRAIRKGSVCVDIAKPRWADKYPERFVQHDIRHPLPFKDEEFEEVRAEHILEHFSPTERQPIVLDWWRVVQPNGHLHIYVPNTVRYIQWLISKKWNMEKFSEMMYGSQDGPGQYHQACYSLYSLHQFLREHLKDVHHMEMSHGRRGQWGAANGIYDTECRAVIYKNPKQ
jgi:predicted SAM-dependent methyltransferase